MKIQDENIYWLPEIPEEKLEEFKKQKQYKHSDFLKENKEDESK